MQNFRQETSRKEIISKDNIKMDIKEIKCDGVD